MAANVTVPDIGAIIPSVKGRRIAYALFALVSFLAGNASIFFAITMDSVPVWLIGLTAVITNSAPAFAGVAIANAKVPE